MDKEMIIIILGAALALSEYLGTTERFKGNSLLQTVTNILKLIKR